MATTKGEIWFGSASRIIRVCQSGRECQLKARTFIVEPPLAGASFAMVCCVRVIVIRAGTGKGETVMATVIPNSWKQRIAAWLGLKIDVNIHIKMSGYGLTAYHPSERTVTIGHEDDWLGALAHEMGHAIGHLVNTKKWAMDKSFRRAINAPDDNTRASEIEAWAIARKIYPALNTVAMRKALESYGAKPEFDLVVRDGIYRFQHNISETAWWL